MKKNPVKKCIHCGKEPKIVQVSYSQNPNLGDCFSIKCGCGIETIYDTLENGLQRWNRKSNKKERT